MKKPPIHQKNTKNYDDLTSLSKKNNRFTTFIKFTQIKLS